MSDDPIVSGKTFLERLKTQHEEIDGESLVSIRPNVKVLTVKNCTSLGTIQLDFLLNLPSPPLFVLIIHLNGAYDDNELKQVCGKIAIPIILQICSFDSCRLFFTNTGRNFNEVTIDDSHNASLSQPFDLNFICNLLHSEPETFGKFSFDLSKMEIDTNACFKGKRLIDLAVEHEDMLVFKLLQLFQPDIEAANNEKDRILEIAIKNGNLKLLKAVLEIPVHEENLGAYLSHRNLQALESVPENDLSLLMLAAQFGKIDIIKFLLKCGLNVNTLNVAEKTACDFAWDNGHLDCVIELLKADSPFPYDYDWDTEPEGSELDQISRQRDNLHVQIRNNEIDDVKSFSKENLKLKCAYDNRNQCALVTALESKNYEIYSFLRSKGFTHGIDEDHDKMLLALTNQEKEALKISNRKYFATNEKISNRKYFPSNENSHIMDLLSRSRLGFGSDQRNFEKIQKYFETLDAIPEVQLILQVISLAKKLNIVFDFNRASIADMDPTQIFEHIGVKGRTIYNNGYIYIGAKSSDSEVLATMAHEFTHYAVHLLYENFGSPYHATDEKTRNDFLEIINYCEARQTENPLIEDVFKYAQNDWASQLIARVPHLLALYHQEANAIAQAREVFGKLFQFFNDRVLSVCEKEVPVMRDKQRIEDSDQFSGVWFNIKDPVELFTGRTKELIDLHEKIQRSKDKLTVISQMVSISGLGGIGKSELARKYAHDYYQYYDGIVIWINAEKFETLRASFYALAKDNRLSISTIDKDGNEKSLKSIVREVYNFFTKRRSLFIFDNAEKFRTQRDGDEGIDKFLPSLPSNANRPYVLITSRNQKWGNVEVISLGTLSKIEAMEFIIKKLKLVDGVQDQDVKKLARTLQYFPLALQEAVAYINQTDIILKKVGSKFGIADYLKRYEKETEKLLDFEFTQDSSDLYTKTTLTTWTKTIEKIEENAEYGKQATELLHMIAYLSPENIPIEIFLNSKLINGDKENLGHSIQLLKQYSMVNEGENRNAVDIHRLVQKVIRLRLKERKKEEENIKNTFELLEKSFPFSGRTVEDYALKKKLLPHLEEFLMHFDVWAAFEFECKKTASYFENLLEWMIDGYSDDGNIAFNNEKDRFLKIAIKIGNLELLKAVLEIPVHEENFGAYLSHRHFQALESVLENDLSLLMLAAQFGKIDIIRFLLECGLNVNTLNVAEKTACDFAWDNGHLDCVIELLKADSPFPFNYEWDEEPEGTELDQISQERDNLHKKIRNNHIDDVKTFLKKNPKIKCAYDNRNQCALVTSLESRHFGIYSFLRSKGFTSGIDEDYVKLLSELTSTEKDDLKLFDRKYFISKKNSYIMDLLSRSRLGFGSDQRNFEKIQKYFETLDAIPEVQLILQVISMAEKLDIVFDFNRQSVADMDLTQNFGHLLVKGRTTYCNGRILISGKSSEAEILAMMAHEFTHYAMHLIYDNRGRPYKAIDHIRRKEFTEIVVFCEALQFKNPVIENVFTYQPDDHASELIVRVPHLLALHMKETNEITKARHNFPLLFRFFTDQVLPDCRREIAKLPSRQLIRDLNRILNLKRTTEALELFCDVSKIDFKKIIKNPQNILIRSTTPELVLCNVLKYFKSIGTENVDSLHIFIKLEQLLDPKLGDIIKQAFESILEPKLFVLESEGTIQFDDIKKLYSYPIMQSRTVSIVKSLLTRKADEKKIHTFFPIQWLIEYNWANLSKTSKTKILSSKILFQGHEITLGDIESDDLFQKLTLKDIFNLSQIRLKTFNESVPKLTDVYITRSFISNRETVYLNSENVIDLLVSEKTLIMAADSGMGKTVSALLFSRKLKQRNPFSWVAFVDLKQHIDSFYKDDEDSIGHISSDFFVNLLKLTGQTEKILLEMFFKNRKLIFIIDGFDEISPVYKKFVIKIVQAIQESNNLLLVTTRTHLANVLEKSLQSRIISIQSFTMDNQLEFFVKFWSRNNKRPIDELKLKAQLLIETCQKIMSREDFLAVPFHIRMLAEIFEHAVPNSDDFFDLNIFSLYRRFVQMKTSLWVEKGPLAVSDMTILMTSSTNILQIHQKLALDIFFPEDLTELMLPEIYIPYELLTRIGLVQFQGPGKLLFTSQSLAEYFVADFVLSNVTKKSLLSKSDELHQMFLEIINVDKFDKIRAFMNGKLETNKLSNVDYLSEKLEKSVLDDINRKFIFNLVKEDLSAMITFLLKRVTITNDAKVSLINQRNENGENTLHFAVRFGNSDSFKKLWSCIESFSSKDDQRELFLSAGLFNMNVLHHAAVGDKNEMIEQILKISSDFMDSSSFEIFLMQENNSKNNALLIAAGNCNRMAFDKIWKAAEIRLDKNVQKNLLLKQNAELSNVFLIAARQKRNLDCVESQDIFYSIMTIAKNLFSYEEMRNFLLTEDIDGNTALHCAAYWGDAKVFSIIWNFIKNVLNIRDQKSSLLKKHGSNIFIKSIECVFTSSSIAKNVLLAAKEVLEIEDIQLALTERNCHNQTFISLATKLGIVENIFEPEDFEWVAREFKAHQRFISFNDNK